MGPWKSKHATGSLRNTEKGWPCNGRCYGGGLGERRLTPSNASTGCWQARRPAVTTPCARSIVTVQRSAPRCAKWSTKSRMRNSETSKPEKWAKPVALTSDRRQRANRANAKSSTGPKSAAGKARAAQNAFRHGLNVPVLSDPLLAPEIEAMARRISSPHADTETAEWARRIAEAQVDLTRVRNSRRQLITRIFVDPAFHPAQVPDSSLRVIKMVLGRFRVLRTLPINADAITEMLSPKPLEGEEKLAIILRKEFQNLPRLIGTNDALCRDAKPRSAILTRLERSPSRNSHTKFNVT